MHTACYCLVCGLLQEIQRQKDMQREQQKLEDMRLMQYLQEKEVCTHVHTL